MIFVCDSMPKHCPACGISLRGDIQDFVAKASFHCPHCEAKYQFVPTEQIVEVAKQAGGDLHIYAGG